MTVNERLYALGLLDEFDRATQERNTEMMASILAKAFLTPADIENIIAHRISMEEETRRKDERKNDRVRE